MYDNLECTAYGLEEETQEHNIINCTILIILASGLGEDVCFSAMCGIKVWLWVLYFEIFGKSINQSIELVIEKLAPLKLLMMKIAATKVLTT